MKPLTKSEREHIQALGSKWPQALAAASMSVRTDPKLIGLDKIRESLAIYAALKATGCPDHEGFVVPKGAGPAVHGFQGICDAAFTAAVEAAERKLRVPA